MRFLTLASLLVITCFAGSSPAKGQVPTKLPAKPPGKVSAVVKKLADTAATTAAGMAADSLLGKTGGAVVNAAGIGGTPCPQTEMPAIPGMPLGIPGIPGNAKASAGAAVVGAVKKAAKNDDSTAPESASASPCVPGAGMPGMPAGAAGGGATMNPMAYTPVGMAVTAAPLAGKAAKGVKGILGGKPQNWTVMLKEMTKGMLELKDVKFIEGTAELEPGFETSLAELAEAMGKAEGTYLLHVAAEQADKGAAPDTTLARKRIEKIMAEILTNGVPADRITPMVELPPELHAGRKPPKRGGARVELIRQ